MMMPAVAQGATSLIGSRLESTLLLERVRCRMNLARTPQRRQACRPRPVSASGEPHRGAAAPEAARVRHSGMFSTAGRTRLPVSSLAAHLGCSGMTGVSLFRVIFGDFEEDAIRVVEVAEALAA